MPSTITITLPTKTKERLGHFAVQYGFAVEAFSRQILEEVASAVPEELLSEYRNPRQLRSSLHRAMQDWRTGRVV